MRRDDVRFAVAAREDGLRRVRSLTTRVGAVGVVSSAVIAVALGHPAGPAVHSSTTGDPTASPSSSTSQGSPSAQGSSAQGSSAQGSSAQGSSAQGNSQQGSSQSSGSQQANSQPSSSPQAPAQNPAPAPGSGQVVSGGS